MWLDGLAELLNKLGVVLAEDGVGLRREGGKEERAERSSASRSRNQSSKPGDLEAEGRRGTTGNRDFKKYDDLEDVMCFSGAHLHRGEK